jgi:hypothetical protein
MVWAIRWYRVDRGVSDDESANAVRAFADVGTVRDDLGCGRVSHVLVSWLRSSARLSAIAKNIPQ